ncbi:unnamed protein product [Rotaria socialis]|uniref:Uncharacterized protein n=1 Tax=Rotaria socialis TaxID=392032 RepID=A0A818FT09_9BILA|nr:unnamed protein product [Rotaria socialis]
MSAVNAGRLRRSVLDIMDEEDLKYALRKIMNNYNMVDDENGEHDFDERRYSDFNAWIKCTCDRDPLKLVGRKVCFDKCENKSYVPN